MKEIRYPHKSPRVSHNSQGRWLSPFRVASIQSNDCSGVLKSPPSGKVRPGAVVPQDVDAPVVREEFADLGVRTGHHPAPFRRCVARTPPVGRAPPIEERIVKTHPEPGLPGSLHVGGTAGSERRRCGCSRTTTGGGATCLGLPHAAHLPAPPNRRKGGRRAEQARRWRLVRYGSKASLLHPWVTTVDFGGRAGNQLFKDG